MSKKTKRQKAKLLAVTVLISALAVGMALIVASFFRQPANGTIISTSPGSLTTPQPSHRALDSKYFSARYSGRFQLLPESKVSASLQNWTLVARQEAGVGQSAKLSLVITPLPSGGVREDSAYKLYEAHPELYTLSESTYGGESVIVSKRSDPTYQQTVLWPHGNYLLTVSLTSGPESELVNNEFGDMLSSLKWNL